MKSFAWSHSALTSFETCPKRHYLIKVAKLVEDKETEDMRWGKRVHKAFENYFKHDTPFSKVMERYQKFANVFGERAEGADEVHVECQWTLNADLEQTGWFDRDAWVRAIADICVLKGKKALVGDWKTGKRKPDYDQLALLALMIFYIFPHIDEVYASFIWLKDGKIDKKTYYREEIDELWSLFTDRIERFEEAFNFDTWPAKPSGLCRRHCPVGKQHCSYCGD